MVVNNERGQSILEVVFILPFLFLFVAFLFKISMAIQMAINNTQYSRAQLYVLAGNSPEYPRIEFRFYADGLFAQGQQDQMIIGVADPEGIDFSDPNGKIEPNPQIQKIGRAQTTVKGSDERGEDVTKRTSIRVRTTASICTQLNAVAPKKPMVSEGPNGIAALKAQRWPFKEPVCQYKGMS
jgi:hypothetical protein